MAQTLLFLMSLKKGYTFTQLGFFYGGVMLRRALQKDSSIFPQEILENFSKELQRATKDTLACKITYDVNGSCYVIAVSKHSSCKYEALLKVYNVNYTLSFHYEFLNICLSYNAFTSLMDKVQNLLAQHYQQQGTRHNHISLVNYLHDVIRNNRLSVNEKDFLLALARIVEQLKTRIISLSAARELATIRFRNLQFTMHFIRPMIAMACGEVALFFQNHIGVFEKKTKKDNPTNNPVQGYGTYIKDQFRF